MLGYLKHLLRGRKTMRSVDKKVASDIEQYGWHCIGIAPRVGEEGTNFTYTIGLTKSYEHPELMIFGLSAEKSHAILSECVDLIKAGKRLPIDEPVADILDRDYNVIFKPIRKDCFGEYLGTAMRYYGHQNFEAYVLFWPDKEHHFVWESPNLSLQTEALNVV